MKFFPLCAIFVLAASTATAEIDCSFRNSLTDHRGVTMSWNTFSSESAVDRISNSFVQQLLRGTKHSAVNEIPKAKSKIYVMCFKKHSGEFLFHRLYLAKPTCDVNSWTGSQECDEYRVEVFSLERAE